MARRLRAGPETANFRPETACCSLPPFTYDGSSPPRGTRMTRLSKFALPVILFVSGPATQAKITNPVTLEQLVKEQPLIFTATVTEWLPEKPGMVIAPVD